MTTPWHTILEQAAQHDCFYLYDAAVMEQQAAQLVQHFPHVTFLYSIKANPAQGVLRTLCAKGFGADAASLREVQQAYRLGMPPERLQYTAPGKQQSDLEAAVGIATIIADSFHELTILQEVAQAKGIHVRAGLRINPPFTCDSDTGLPSKFGVDAADAEHFLRTTTLPNVTVTGVHVHVRSQELCVDTLARYYAKLLRLATRIQAALGRPLDFVNMGSGMGIPYASDAAPLDTQTLGAQVTSHIQACQASLRGTRFFMESGRFLVGPAGYYVTTVLDRKTSMGVTYIIVKNTLNGFLRPVIAQLLARYVPQGTLAACEPLFTQRDGLQLLTNAPATTTERVTLVGNLCTANDVIATDVVLPRLRRGDLIVMPNAGSYGASLSPLAFSAHEPPAQVLLRRDGSVCDATR